MPGKLFELEGVERLLALANVLDAAGGDEDLAQEAVRSLIHGDEDEPVTEDAVTAGDLSTIQNPGQQFAPRRKRLNEASSLLESADGDTDGGVLARTFAGVLNALAYAGEDDADLADELSEELEAAGWMLTRHPRGLWVATPVGDPGDEDMMEADDWDESKHPRAEDGKFGSGGGGGTQTDGESADRMDDARTEDEDAMSSDKKEPWRQTKAEHGASGERVQIGDWYDGPMKSRRSGTEGRSYTLYRMADPEENSLYDTDWAYSPEDTQAYHEEGRILHKLELKIPPSKVADEDTIREVAEELGIDTDDNDAVDWLRKKKLRVELEGRGYVAVEFGDVDPDGGDHDTFRVLKSNVPEEDDPHRDAVAAALAAGEDVPPEVLAEYPDIVK